MTFDLCCGFGGILSRLHTRVRSVGRNRSLLGHPFQSPDVRIDCDERPEELVSDALLSPVAKDTLVASSTLEHYTNSFAINRPKDQSLALLIFCTR